MTTQQRLDDLERRANKIATTELRGFNLDLLSVDERATVLMLLDKCRVETATPGVIDYDVVRADLLAFARGEELE